MFSYERLRVLHFIPKELSPKDSLFPVWVITRPDLSPWKPYIVGICSHHETPWTNYYKTLWLNGNNPQLLSHRFCGLGVQAQLSWAVWVKVSHKAAFKVLARAVVSSKDSFMWFGTGFSSPRTVGRRASLSSLLAGGWRLPSVPKWWGPL